MEETMPQAVKTDNSPRSVTMTLMRIVRPVQNSTHRKFSAKSCWRILEVTAALLNSTLSSMPSMRDMKTILLEYLWVM
jgi:hypothetical protein